MNLNDFPKTDAYFSNYCLVYFLLLSELSYDRYRSDNPPQHLSRDHVVVTQLFSELAFEIANEKGLLGKRLHLDSTSFVLYGDYDDCSEIVIKIP